MSVAAIIASFVVVPLSMFIAESACTSDEKCTATSSPTLLAALGWLALVGAVGALGLILRGSGRVAALVLGITAASYLAWGVILYRAVNDQSF
jgi:hypothetical protein